MTPTILIIDDDDAVHRTVEQQLEEVDARIVHAHQPILGIQMATRDLPDLILLDMNMPVMDGLKVCTHLKEHEETRHIPILFLTVADNVNQVARALEIGANDYIRKPVEPMELRARVRASLRTKRMVDLLRVQARIDALTGLMNRAALDDALVASLSAYHRAGAAMSLLMIDVDHFKEINDASGHGVGDDILRQLGEVIGSACRPHDTACRFGGDEFAMIFGHTGGLQATQAAQRLLGEISKARITTQKAPVTVSAGLISVEDLPDKPQPADLLKAADEALYRAKAQGRNQLVVSEGP
jgi:two-component system cell cycle response regulator